VQGASARAGSPSLTQIQALARYAARATFDDLSPESRQQLPVHMLDSLGCCSAALGAGPVQACREQVADFGGSDPCPVHLHFHFTLKGDKIAAASIRA
jgi:2-methylcitrate dehydratase PrpD